MDRRFEDKVVMITGVGDGGIGAAIAERLAEEGAAVTVLWKDHPTRLFSRFDRRNVPYVECECDVTLTTDINDAIDVCMSQFGQIDVVVNNAGVEAAAPFEDLSDELWETALAVNLTGAMKVSRAVLPYLPEQEGVIVNIASALGMTGCSTFSAYSASKAGLIGMTQSLALELAPRGIRAVCIAPALVHTPMLHRHIADLTPEIAQQIDSCHPLGVGTPYDVAAAVGFLASREARWISGVSLPLGWLPAFDLPTEPFQKRPTGKESRPVPSTGTAAPDDGESRNTAAEATIR